MGRCKLVALGEESTSTHEVAVDDNDGVSRTKPDVKMGSFAYNGNGGSCTWDEDVTRRTLAEGLSHCL